MSNEIEQTKKAVLARLIQARKDKKLSQTDVANYLKIKQSSFSDIENGKTELSLETFLSLIKLYDLPETAQFWEPTPEPVQNQDINFLDYLLQNQDKLEAINQSINLLLNNVSKIRKDFRAQLNIKLSPEQKAQIIETARARRQSVLKLVLSSISEKTIKNETN